MLNATPKVQSFGNAVSLGSVMGGMTALDALRFKVSRECTAGVFATKSLKNRLILIAKFAPRPQSFDRR